MEQITFEILSSYFQCKRKSFLILKASNAYKKTEFELMIEKYASDTKISYCSDKKAKVYYDGIFEKGIELYSRC